MNQRTTHSSLEKNFQTQTTFKRNTRYYNAFEIQSIEKNDSIRRRKPIPHSDLDTQRKIDQSFTNSTTILSSKVHQQIGKYSRRISPQFSPPKSNYEKQYSSPSSPKLKSFSIQKMISREHIDHIKNKPVQDQRMFNNFKIQKPDLSRTCDFSKLRGKSLEFNLKHINDVYHESKKPYEYCFYKDTTLKTKVNYKVENKQKKRYFFIRKRSTDFPATILDPEKVDYGFKIATNFKQNNISHDNIAPFYAPSGRQLPCQLDMRYMTHLSNYYKDNNQKLVLPHTDYTIKKLKQDLISRRQDLAKMPKNPVFTRDEVCDKKYFNSQIALKKNKKLLAG